MLNLNPQLSSAIIGGLIALSGALIAREYQNHIQKRNLRRVLVVEIELITEVLELLVAANRLESEGEIEYQDFDLIDEMYIEDFQFEHPYRLVQQASYQADQESYNEIYTSNTDKIGKLPPDQSKEVIQFYSYILQVYQDLEVILPEAQSIMTGKEGTNPQIVRDYLYYAERAFHQQKKALTRLRTPWHKRKALQIRSTIADLLI
jgi:hypothetical protein